MSALCDHARPDYHHEGETCRCAADLKPGDQVGIVTGAHVTILEAHPNIEPGRTSVLFTNSTDGPTRIASDTILPVRPADGLAPETGCTGTDSDERPCRSRPAFTVTTPTKAQALACEWHIPDLLHATIGPERVSATVTAYEGA
ncbi:hypothetical protein ACFVY0_40495 [Streptomyces sp. NPDC058286]|uniref:hypothetical protein n=1 Tax=Streptomyces sp. NPDC058286 TaxID=3346422 RepID=UPI0036EC70CC